VTSIVAAFIILFLGLGAAFHFYWGLGGRIGRDVAVPARTDGTRIMDPSPAATFAVAIVLALIVALLAAHLLSVPVPRVAMRAAFVMLGSAFLARGFSWHPYFGLFKRVRTTAFARNDTWIYSPGCVLTGLGLLYLAWG
jgi:Protein of unknown function (DUF3995)